jgi:hypothetical protein
MSMILRGGRFRGHADTVDDRATHMLSDLVIDLVIMDTDGIPRALMGCSLASRSTASPPS